ncbi:cytidine deaminase-like [Corticium candelabrum]|uniref:cytidine deaminase-like n=1 Tax=Corticium candelabrum TaxID=121492 RepID=UPI002E25CA7B|nr:cytidine deaminase-like [Corticium candelabrum]
MDKRSLGESSIQELVKACQDAKLHAYCPYSHFRVGAALLTDDDRLFTGCNVENSSYGLSICAERTAIVKAVSEGCRKFKAIAVACDMREKTVTPCGACRQFLSEFGSDWTVVLTKPDLSYTCLSVSDLLPHHFSAKDLEAERV